MVAKRSREKAQAHGRGITRILLSIHFKWHISRILQKVYGCVGLATVEAMIKKNIKKSIKTRQWAIYR